MSHKQCMLRSLEGPDSEQLLFSTAKLKMAKDEFLFGRLSLDYPTASSLLLFDE